MPLSKINTNSISNTASPTLTSPTLSSPVINSGATISGNTNFDSGTMFVDSVNNRVGVGTINPEYAFQSAGAIQTTAQFITNQSFNGAYQNMDKQFYGKPHTGSVSVPTNNAWTTVFTIGNGQGAASSSTGAVYGFLQDSTSGFIHVYRDWGGAYILGWVAFTSKCVFDFNHLNILSSYGYQAGIQISGQSIQVRQTGNNAGPVYFSIYTFG